MSVSTIEPGSERNREMLERILAGATQRGRALEPLTVPPPPPPDAVDRDAALLAADDLDPASLEPRRRGGLILGVAVALAMLLLGAGGFLWLASQDWGGPQQAALPQTSVPPPPPSAPPSADAPAPPSQAAIPAPAVARPDLPESFLAATSRPRPPAVEIGLTPVEIEGLAPARRVRAETVIAPD